MTRGRDRENKPSYKVVTAWTQRDERSFKTALDQDECMIEEMGDEYYRYFYSLPVWGLGFRIMDERVMYPIDELSIDISGDEY